MDARTPACPSCRAADVAPAASLPVVRRVADRVALDQLGPRPDPHVFNYAVAALGMIFVCVAIPGTAWDFIRAGLCEGGLLGMALVVNATLLRDRAAAIDAYDRQRRSLVDGAV